MGGGTGMVWVLVEEGYSLTYFTYSTNLLWFTEIYFDLLIFTYFYWDLLSFTEIYIELQRFTEIYFDILRITKIYLYTTYIES